MYTNYSEMARKISNIRPFKGNSVTAIKYNSKQNGLVYEIYSYNTCIFRVWCEDGELKDMFDNRYYSSTTSKIQNMIIRSLPLLFESIPTKRDGKVYNL